MNHYAAREVTRDGGRTGKWRYTVAMRGGDIQPVGYCAEAGDHAHEAAAAACECFRRWKLDTATFNGTYMAVRVPCERPGCTEYTDRFASTFGSLVHYALCAEHCNRADLDLTMGPVADMWTTFGPAGLEAPPAELRFDADGNPVIVVGE